MTKTVVILGGSLAGLHVAHALLKKRKQEDLKVIIVSKNSHFYWNLASVRAIIPGQIKDEDIFKPLESALSRYPADSWELIIGAATAADFTAKTIEVNVSADNTTRTLSYDQLVLATGARAASPNMPWKASNSYEEVLANLHATAARVQLAEHIVVGGAGGTGIEVAGELAYEYGKTKTIILLCPDEKLAKGHSIAKAAEEKLCKLNVSIKYGTRIRDVRPSAQAADRTCIELMSGETITTNLYLPTTGLIPNTEYIPARHLSANAAYRTVLVDEFLRVQDAQDVWACGDIVSQPRAGFFITKHQAASVAKNVRAALAGKPPAKAKKPPVDIFACAVGRTTGVGRMNSSIRLPGPMVWLAKGRTLAVPMVKEYIDGSVA